jgi:hypothetical protein
VIRLTDKAGYSMVLDESEYKNKFVSIRAEWTFARSSCSQGREKRAETFSKHKTALPADLKRKQTPYHSDTHI